MAPPRDASLPLMVCLLAGLLIALPWVGGGQSAVGHVSLLLFLVLAGFLGLFPPGRNVRLRPSPALLLAGTLALASAASTTYPDRTVQGLLLLLAYLLAGTLAALGTRETPGGGRVILAALAASGAVTAAAGIIGLARGSGWGMYASLLTGPFGYPNAMAGFLLLAGGAALVLAREVRTPPVRYAAWAAGGLAAIGLPLTRSRGALLACAVGLGAWALVDRASWWHRRRLWLGMAGGALAVVLVVRGRLLLQFMAGLWNPGGIAWDTSFVWRWHILGWTWDMVRDHPWLGVGPGAFPVALNRYERIPYVGGKDPHNLYLEVAAEFGLPAALFLLVMLAWLFGRIGFAIRKSPTNAPARRYLGPLLAALTAFACHSALDQDWSFPAIAFAAAVLVGISTAHLTDGRSHRRFSRIWRLALIVILAAAALVAGTRYYASVLTEAGRFALTTGELSAARWDLRWALRLNPLSFAAHEAGARAAMQAGDPQDAIRIADQMTYLAPTDPNSQFLAGEIAAASGRWLLAQKHFGDAVELASSSQLRFHAGLVEALAKEARSSEARWRYERALTIFTPRRVMADEARCLAPGDRYLLARMSRIAAALYAESGDGSREQTTSTLAEKLAEPDARGICATQGPPGQRSPEEAVQGFWHALGEGGWPGAARFLAPGLSPLLHGTGGGRDTSSGTLAARVSWIASLTGGERRVALEYQMERDIPHEGLQDRCARTLLRLGGDGWILEQLPIILPGPCRP